MRTPAINLIKFYQKTISPRSSPGFFGEFCGCRFYPSCSEYSIQAIDKYGLLRGLLKGAFRILRCGPWSRGGYNPLQ